MLAWALLVGTVGYLICTLLAARAAYGIHRRQVIALESRNPSPEDPIENFEAYDRQGAAAAAFIAGLAWPPTVPAYCAYRLAAVAITARPRPSAYERRLRAERARARIRELEDEPEEALDIPDGHGGAEPAADVFYCDHATRRSR